MADTYELVVIQGERLRRGFRNREDDVAQSFTGYSWRAEIRQKEDTAAELVLDLTPYMSLDPGDETLLWLDVPASITRGLPKFRDSAAWDFFLWPTGDEDSAFVFIQGPATRDPATTR